MQFPLIPDIRKKDSSLTYQGKTYHYSVTFSKTYKRISIEKMEGDNVTLLAPVGTSPDAIETRIRDIIDRKTTAESENQIKRSEESHSGTISINTFDIPYSVKINPRKRGPCISVHSDGAIEVTIPYPVPIPDIIRFLESEKEWIHREYFKTRPECPPETETLFIQIGDKEIPYLVRRSARAKRTTIKILGSGAIEVSAPYNAERSSIVAFVERNTEWIAPRIDLVPDKSAIEPVSKQSTRKGTGEQHHVNYEGHCIPYQIIRSKRAKRITIKVDRNRNVTVVAPTRTKLSDVASFIQQNASWVYEHTIRSTRPISPIREYVSGETFPFLGKTIKIQIETGNPPHFKRDGDLLIIYVPASFNEFNRKSLVKQAISTYFSEELYQFVMPFLTSYAAKLGVPVPPVKTRDQKTKWGACSHNSIIFNLRLCMAPPEIIEYVVVHELAHKKQMNHSPHFWKTVESMMPDYQERRNFLKKNGHLWVL